MDLVCRFMICQLRSLNYLDDVVGGRGSIVSIVRATDEIANRAQILMREPTISPRLRTILQPRPVLLKPHHVAVWTRKPCLLALSIKSKIAPNPANQREAYVRFPLASRACDFGEDHRWE